MPHIQASQFEASTRTDVALKQILASLFEQLTYYELKILAGDTAEPVHDFRITVRRTRSLLSQFKSCFPKRIWLANKNRFAWLGDISNPARDLQVYLEKINGYQACLPKENQPHIIPLMEFLEAQSEYHIRALQRQLGSQRYLRLKKSWQTYLESPITDRTTLVKAKRPVKQSANKQIWKYFCRIDKKHPCIKSPPTPLELHKMRIDCKKLRYLLEFFESLYPDDIIKPLIHSLKEIQDDLGAVHDLYVEMETLKTFRAQMAKYNLLSADVKCAVRILLKMLHQHQKQLRSKSCQSLRKFQTKNNRTIFRTTFKEGA